MEFRRVTNLPSYVFTIIGQLRERQRINQAIRNITDTLPDLVAPEAST